MSLTFNITPESKVQLVRGQYTKELAKEAFVEILQLLVTNIAPNRDYSNVISIKKLIRIIDLECEPDESDGEESPTAQPVVAISQEPAKKAPPRRRAPAKNDDDD